MHWPDMRLGENWSHAGIGILADTEPMTQDSVLNIHYLVLQFGKNMYTKGFLTLVVKTTKIVTGCCIRTIPEIEKYSEPWVLG